MLFFFAGFETVSTALCFMIHEIAVHPDVQTRLRKEIDEVLKDDNGEVTYDALTFRMKYLDMVVSGMIKTKKLEFFNLKTKIQCLSKYFRIVEEMAPHV